MVCMLLNLRTAEALWLGPMSSPTLPGDDAVQKSFIIVLFTTATVIINYMYVGHIAILA